MAAESKYNLRELLACNGASVLNEVMLRKPRCPECGLGPAYYRRILWGLSDESVGILGNLKDMNLGGGLCPVDI